MAAQYTPPPLWKPPPQIEPSNAFKGERDTTVIHEAVGRALSTWEHAESALIKLFQVLCETKSFAACRAYGTLDSVFARHLALKYAAEEFFASREETDLKLVTSLINVYMDAVQYRNQVAHGMAVQPHAHDYFLCPPSYASRRRTVPRPSEPWALGADYFYRATEIEHLRTRFEHVLSAAMSLAMYLNSKYKVISGEDFHP